MTPDPDQLGLTSEVIRDAAMLVSEEIHGRAMGVDLDMAERTFRAMVQKIHEMDGAAHKAGVDLLRISASKST